MQHSRNVYLVGSIPLTRTYDVFTTIAEILGTRVRRVPDGEIGDRIMWVQGQYSYLINCPALENTLIPDNGLDRTTGYQIPVRLREGARANDIVFDEIGYARHAIASYTVLRALKDAGRVPETWRLQVGLPAPMDVMTLVDPGSRAAVEPA